MYITNIFRYKVAFILLFLHEKYIMCIYYINLCMYNYCCINIILVYCIYHRIIHIAHGHYLKLHLQTKHHIEIK